MVAMVATDDKRRLTDVERSRGVQQMLLLGVDPERRARGSHAQGIGGQDQPRPRRRGRCRRRHDARAHAGHRRVRGGRRLRGGRHAGGMQRVGVARDVAHSISAKRARAEKVSAILTACAGRHRPGAGAAEIRRRVLLPRLRERSGGDRGQARRAARGNRRLALRGKLPRARGALLPPRRQSAGPEAEARAELVREVASLIEAGSERRARWFARNDQRPRACPNVKNALLGSLFAEPDGFHGRIPKDDLDRFAELAGDGFDAPDMALSGAVAAYLYVAKGGELHSTYSRELVAGCNNGYVMLRLRAWMEWMAAFAADGYAYDEGDARLMSMAEQAIESCDEEEEE